MSEVKKVLQNEGNPDHQVCLNDSISVDIKLFSKDSQILIPTPKTCVLASIFTPNEFIQIVTSMFLNEISDFYLPKPYFLKYFSKWCNAFPESNIKMTLEVLAIYKPFDIFQDGHYICRLFNTFHGRSVPHSKSKYDIYCKIESENSEILEVNSKIIRIFELPFVYQESLKYMNEGDTVVVTCGLDNENSVYLSGSNTIFDINQYKSNGNVTITLKINRFINGRSVIKSANKFISEIQATVTILIEKKLFKETEPYLIQIVDYLENLNDPIFDEIKNDALRKLSFLYNFDKNYQYLDKICRKMLKIDPLNEVALYRKSVARINLQKNKGVFEDLIQAKKISKQKGNFRLTNLVKQELQKLEILSNQDTYWKIERF